MAHENQQPMNVDQPSQAWRIRVSNYWDVLGPFPIHAREQYFLSPAFPLEVTPKYTHEEERMWPSSYSSSGLIGWSEAFADDDGNLAVSFPEVDWNTLRSTEGWAALQYHSVLRTKLTVYPPDWDPEDDLPIYEVSDTDSDSEEEEVENTPFRILVSLLRGSQFTLLPPRGSPVLNSSKPFVPAWHCGNIYDLSKAPPNAVDLPSPPYRYRPTTYDVFVSGDYEIRLFGDPKDSNDTIPTLQISFKAWPEVKESKIVREISHDIVPDFVDGYAFGNAISVGLRSVDGWWIVHSLVPGNDFPPELDISLRHEIMDSHIIKLGLLGPQRLAPTQTRMVPLILKQNAPCRAESITFTLDLVELKPMEDFKESSRRVSLEVTLRLRQLKPWSTDDYDLIRATFLFKKSNPASFLVKPPLRSNENGGTDSPLLALHGAGVDIFASTYWADAIPRQSSRWIVIPPGRTEWGLDWHGPSTAEAWASVSALRDILTQHRVFRTWAFTEDSKVVLIGHSNGGQGVWYMASHYPDRVLAAIPAAGYIKSQAYVPLTQSRSAHYMDPSLRAVLESSFTPDDNDLFLSNLVDIPVLAIHGGADTNVPTWHSRQYIATLKEWGATDATLHIDEGKPHFYPEVFKGAHVSEFLGNLSEEKATYPPSPSFTLTVVNPAHSGSLRGWTIDSLKVPGRIARLRVSLENGYVYARTENVKRFTVGRGAFGYTTVASFEIDKWIIDSREFPEPDDRTKVTFVYKQSCLEWQIAGPLNKKDEEESEEHRLQPRYRGLSLGGLHGRAQEILDSPDSHIIVVPKFPKHALSAAQRIAHVLNVYHKLDAAIITEDEAMSLWLCVSIDLPPGNIISIGRSEFTKEIINHHFTPFYLHGAGLKYTYYGHNKYSGPGTGFVLLHPHLTNPEAKSIVVSGTDWEGTERAIRLFPYRTGVPVPDFTVIGPAADSRGAGGVLGAGVFDDLWKHNPPMTYLT